MKTVQEQFYELHCSCKKLPFTVSKIKSKKRQSIIIFPSAVDEIVPTVKTKPEQTRRKRAPQDKKAKKQPAKPKKPTAKKQPTNKRQTKAKKSTKKTNLN